MDSCLFIHGFTGGEHEISPLSRFMEQHHYRSRTFTLKGHGGSKEDLRNSDRHDWQRSAEDELMELLRTEDGVHLIGFSTGALIASHLSVHYKPRIKSLTLLSTPVFPLNPLEIVKTLSSKAMLRNYWRKFGSTPPKATWEFRRLVRESFDVYPLIETPTLIVQGQRDHLVQTKSAKYLQRIIKAPNKQVMLIEGSGHMVCHCEDKDRIMNEVLQFIQNAGSR
ncbi:alpha/beta fold hydrolase [Paenibacillus albidus]|uniref:alpha/beta hydrolase n=1 Tax=Paenibacillus albidus TaxID=2041023 RepID=UPI001BE79AF5|nr:alpha/beta fold hydrolase [Paenibacillus albidus]MBT2291888.1 alpha/beta fold hydrolase [Paenibacillus albidus]